MLIDDISEMWCRLFGYASCYYVPSEMAVVLGALALLAAFGIIAVLHGMVQRVVTR